MCQGSQVHLPTWSPILHQHKEANSWINIGLPFSYLLRKGGSDVISSYVWKILHLSKGTRFSMDCCCLSLDQYFNHAVPLILLDFSTSICRGQGHGNDTPDGCIPRITLLWSIWKFDKKHPCMTCTHCKAHALWGGTWRIVRPIAERLIPFNSGISATKDTWLTQAGMFVFVRLEAWMRERAGHRAVWNEALNLSPICDATLQNLIFHATQSS